MNECAGEFFKHGIYYCAIRIVLTPICAKRTDRITRKSSIRRANCDDFHLADCMIHPPNDSMRAENSYLPVATVLATYRKVTIPRDIRGDGFQPRDQALACGQTQGCEVIEARLPQPDLIRRGHTQGLVPSWRFTSSSVTQPTRSGEADPVVASSHSPFCFIRAKARNAASSRCSSGRSAALSFLSSAKDMAVRWHRQAALPRQ